jgi:hypothetical protein
LEINQGDNLFHLETALHVSGGTTTHHQERKQLYLQHLVFVTPLLLPATQVRQIPDAVDTVVCAPDDGWRYHPKHVEQFPDEINCVNVASCWTYVRTEDPSVIVDTLKYIAHFFSYFLKFIYTKFALFSKIRHDKVLMVQTLNDIINVAPPSQICTISVLYF